MFAVTPYHETTPCIQGKELLRQIITTTGITKLWLSGDHIFLATNSARDLYVFDVVPQLKWRRTTPAKAKDCILKINQEPTVEVVWIKSEPSLIYVVSKSGSTSIWEFLRPSNEWVKHKTFQLSNAKGARIIDVKLHEETGNIVWCERRGTGEGTYCVCCRSINSNSKDEKWKAELGTTQAILHNCPPIQIFSFADGICIHSCQIYLETFCIFWSATKDVKAVVFKDGNVEESMNCSSDFRDIATALIGSWSIDPDEHHLGIVGMTVHPSSEYLLVLNHRGLVSKVRMKSNQVKSNVVCKIKLPPSVVENIKDVKIFCNGLTFGVVDYCGIIFLFDVVSGKCMNKIEDLKSESFDVLDSCSATPITIFWNLKSFWKLELPTLNDVVKTISNLTSGSHDEARLNSELHGCHDEARLNSEVHGSHDEVRLNSEVYGIHDEARLNAEEYGSHDEVQLNSDVYGIHDEARLNAEVYGSHDEARLNSEVYGSYDEIHLNSEMHGSHDKVRLDSDVREIHDEVRPRSEVDEISKLNSCSEKELNQMTHPMGLGLIDVATWFSVYGLDHSAAVLLLDNLIIRLETRMELPKQHVHFLQTLSTKVFQNPAVLLGLCDQQLSLEDENLADLKHFLEELDQGVIPSQYITPLNIQVQPFLHELFNVMSRVREVSSLELSNLSSVLGKRPGVEVDKALQSVLSGSSDANSLDMLEILSLHEPEQAVQGFLPVNGGKFEVGSEDGAGRVCAILRDELKDRRWKRRRNPDNAMVLGALFKLLYKYHPELLMDIIEIAKSCVGQGASKDETTMKDLEECIRDFTLEFLPSVWSDECNLKRLKIHSDLLVHLGLQQDAIQVLIQRELWQQAVDLYIELSHHSTDQRVTSQLYEMLLAGILRGSGTSQRQLLVKLFELKPEIIAIHNLFQLCLNNVPIEKAQAILHADVLTVKEARKALGKFLPNT